MRIERRTFLRTSPLVAAATITGMRGRSAAEPSEGFTFDDCVAKIGALAKSAIADPSRNEDAYLYEVASVAARIDRVPDVKLGAPFTGIFRTGLNYRGSGIVVVQWSMEAGLTYPAHNHPRYNGITLGIEGECRIRNFTPVGPLPEMATPARFQIQQTQDQVLRPGRVVSVMSTDHDNIHTLRTFSKAVRGIDVMTLLGPHIGFSFVEIDEKSKRGEDVYDATWGERMGK